MDDVGGDYSPQRPRRQRLHHLPRQHPRRHQEPARRRGHRHAHRHRRVLLRRRDHPRPRRPRSSPPRAPTACSVIEGTAGNDHIRLEELGDGPLVRVNDSFTGIFNAPRFPVRQVRSFAGRGGNDRIDVGERFRGTLTLVGDGAAGESGNDTFLINARTLAAHVRPRRRRATTRLHGRRRGLRRSSSCSRAAPASTRSSSPAERPGRSTAIHLPGRRERHQRPRHRARQRPQQPHRRRPRRHRRCRLPRPRRQRHPDRRPPAPTDLFGEEGDDTLIGGPGNDTLDGGPGNNTLDHGDGNTHPADRDRRQPASSPRARTGNDTFNIVRTGTDDVRVTVNSVVRTFDMDDYETIEFRGGAGNDTMSAGAGVLDLTMLGEAGDDRLTGNDATNWLYGGIGNDTLTGNGVTDLLEGGDGNDTLFARDGVHDTVNGGAGHDRASSTRTTAAAASRKSSPERSQGREDALTQRQPRRGFDENPRRGCLRVRSRPCGYPLRPGMQDLSDQQLVDALNRGRRARVRRALLPLPRLGRPPRRPLHGQPRRRAGRAAGNVRVRLPQVPRLPPDGEHDDVPLPRREKPLHRRPAEAHADGVDRRRGDARSRRAERNRPGAGSAASSRRRWRACRRGSARCC